jgi:hypothetical protein
MRLLGPLLLAACSLAAPSALAATGMSVTIDQDLAEQLGLDPAALEASLGGAIQDELHLGDAQAFLGAMADAQALATKGMGVDYASNFDKLMVGWSVGSGVSSGGATFGKGGQELPDYGFSFQMAATVGLNLGVLSGGEGFLERVVIFGHGMTLDTGGDTFGAHLLNYGGHLQLRLIKPRDAEVVAWGGLALTAGFEHAEYRLDLQQGLPVAAPGTGVDMTWDATGDYVMKAWSDSVPLELSTNLRILVATAFVGAGMDYNTGSATTAMELSGPIEADAPGGPYTLGEATVSTIQSGTPGPSFPRVFGGLQLNIFMMKLYGQVNVGLDEGFGGHAGVRIAL